jgi:hypothetical protein
VGKAQHREPDVVRSFEETVGTLYRSGGHDLAAIVSTLPVPQRARMALFCYGRAHMRDLGLAIAAMCDEATLVDCGAAAGQALFQMSRQRPRDESKPLTGRYRITLASFDRSQTAFQDAEPELAADDLQHDETVADFAPELERAAG